MLSVAKVFNMQQIYSRAALAVLLASGLLCLQLAPAGGASLRGAYVLQSASSLSENLTLQLPQGCAVDLNGGPSRSEFPPNFTFGTATAAYQVEGVGEGRGRNIWDDWVDTPGKVADGSNAHVADDHYHHYENDIALMKGLGTTSYRLSIAWGRILPNGTGEPDEVGIAFYNRLIDALVSAGIEPAVTLYHWDLPSALYEKDGAHGWLRSSIVYATSRSFLSAPAPAPAHAPAPAPASAPAPAPAHTPASVPLLCFCLCPSPWVCLSSPSCTPLPREP
eukprot:jgi/Mesen1/1489/ME000132S00429